MLWRTSACKRAAVNTTAVLAQMRSTAQRRRVQTNNEPQDVARNGCTSGALARFDIIAGDRTWQGSVGQRFRIPRKRKVHSTKRTNDAAESA
jgi:hypothetical protein